MKRKSKRKSFTLVETIAATVLLSLSVVVLAGIGIHSLRTARSITIDEQAWDIVDRQLTMVDYIGVQTYLLYGPTEGEFEGDGVTFDWKLKISETTLDYLYKVSVTVSWFEQKRYKKIQAQTRLSGY